MNFDFGLKGKCEKSKKFTYFRPLTEEEGGAW